MHKSNNQSKCILNCFLIDKYQYFLEDTASDDGGSCEGRCVCPVIHALNYVIKPSSKWHLTLLAKNSVNVCSVVNRCEGINLYDAMFNALLAVFATSFGVYLAILS